MSHGRDIALGVISDDVVWGGWGGGGKAWRRFKLQFYNIEC